MAVYTLGYGYRHSHHAVSRKTQVTLTDRQHSFLRDEADRTGLSMAELVRRAIDLAYRPFERPRLGGFEVSLGVFRRPDAAMTGRRGAPAEAMPRTRRS
jgi:hypothetical protein